MHLIAHPIPSLSHAGRLRPITQALLLGLLSLGAWAADVEAYDPAEVMAWPAGDRAIPGVDLASLQQTLEAAGYAVEDVQELPATHEWRTVHLWLTIPPATEPLHLSVTVSSVGVKHVHFALAGTLLLDDASPDLFDYVTGVGEVALRREVADGGAIEFGFASRNVAVVLERPASFSQPPADRYAPVESLARGIAQHLESLPTVSESDLVERLPGGELYPRFRRLIRLDHDPRLGVADTLPPTTGRRSSRRNVSCVTDLVLQLTSPAGAVVTIADATAGQLGVTHDATGIRVRRRAWAAGVQPIEVVLFDSYLLQSRLQTSVEVIPIGVDPWPGLAQWCQSFVAAVETPPTTAETVTTPDVTALRTALVELEQQVARQDAATAITAARDAAALLDVAGATPYERGLAEELLDMAVWFAVTDGRSFEEGDVWTRWDAGDLPGAFAVLSP